MSAPQKNPEREAAFKQTIDLAMQRGVKLVPGIALQKILGARDLKRGHKAVALALVHRSDDPTWGTTKYPASLGWIATRAGYKPSATRVFLHELEKFGYILTRPQHTTDGTQIENLYMLNPAKFGPPLALKRGDGQREPGVSSEELAMRKADARAVRNAIEATSSSAADAQALAAARTRGDASELLGRIGVNPNPSAPLMRRRA